MKKLICALALVSTSALAAPPAAVCYRNTFDPNQTVRCTQGGTATSKSIAREIISAASPAACKAAAHQSVTVVALCDAKGNYKMQGDYAKTTTKFNALAAAGCKAAAGTITDASKTLNVCGQ
ncbi:MAG: hypothetical protein JST92_06960 [Deltaproteobacteria bacterium]|nr:hypothetical protein [Deltaproteobacteria bacterium]